MIKLHINRKYLLIHFLLSITIFFIGSPLVLLPIFFVTIVYFLYKKDYNLFLLGGLYSLCMNSDLVYYLYSILVMVLVFSSTKKHNLPVAKIKFFFSLFVVYLIALYFIQLFYNFSILSMPLFTLTFLSPVATFFFIGKLPENKISLSFIINNILSLAIVQAGIAFFFQALPIGISTVLSRATYGDRLIGTTGNSNNLTLLLAAGILPFFLNILHKYYNRKQKTWIMLVAVTFVAMMLLSDSKTYLYALCIVFFGNYLLNKFFFNKKIVTKIIFLLSFSISILFSVDTLNAVLNQVSVNYWEYLYGKYNSKAQYYEYTFSSETRPFYQYVIGTGPGTNGTRASNALAYDVLYKKENTVTLPSFIPPHSSIFTKRYLSNLFTQDYADTSGYRSAILGNPFNSICAIFIEFGIVGSTLFFLFLFSLIKENFGKGNLFLSGAAFLLLAGIMVVSFLDQTLEIPIAMHMVYLLFGLSIKKRS